MNEKVGKGNDTQIVIPLDPTILYRLDRAHLAFHQGIMNVNEKNGNGGSGRLGNVNMSGKGGQGVNSVMQCNSYRSLYNIIIHNNAEPTIFDAIPWMTMLRDLDFSFPSPQSL